MTTLTQELGAGASTDSRGRGWSLWRHQIAAIFRLEFGKSFFGRRAILLYLAALMPIGLVAAFDVTVVLFADAQQTVVWATQQFYTGLYQGLILRMIVFFGCVWVFINLFRGEVLDRSLHYYFLAPVRREVLVVGKYIAGVAATVVLFGGTTVLSYLLIYLPFGGEAVSTHLLGGPGLGQVASYFGVTVLACLGYGAVFLLLGLFFKNPIIPAGAILLWESIHFLLPGLLKKMTVIHYLKPLCPVELPEGPFAIVVDPPPAWVSISGLLVLSAVLVLLAAWRTRTMEIAYGED